MIDRGLRPNSYRTTTMRLRQTFARHLELPVSDVTPMLARRLYESMTKTLAVDSHRNRLSEIKTFYRWCIKQGWTKRNPFAGVEPTGRRSRGKVQLSIDEARRFADVCQREAEDGNHNAFALLLCLYLGLRAAEVTERQVRDFDDDCRLLWIRQAKTEAGVRRVEIPESLRELAKRFVAGRGAVEYVIPVTRFGLLKAMYRLCARARVQRVSVHSLRGLHATLATAAGASSHLVSTALGHTSTAITERHYTAAGERRQADARAVLKLIDGGKR